MDRERRMELPRIVVAHSGAVEQIAEICSHLKLRRRALIISGTRTRGIVGEGIFDQLSESGFDPHMIIMQRSRIDEVKQVEEHAKEIAADFIIGAGGGRSIDLAKLASLHLDIPFISVPTAASHDGICSSMASLTVDGEARSIPARAPLAVIADTSVIASAPARMLSAGCGDIISNHTAIMDWRLAHRLRNEEYSEYAAALSSMTARMIVELAPTIRPGLEESAKVVIQALISSGVAMSIAGSSRPASGSEHMFAHSINRLSSSNALHGELCGIGTIIMMYIHGGDWEMIREALHQLKAPTTASQVGIDEELLIEALTMAHKIRPERYTILGTGLTKEAAIKAAETTEVI
ncbi:MAG: NAD(P)-dependent glycerol-1-phosphate dehydrogenase [Methanotrichaceae archaeon]|nr:NAD(P)-dependent glycerol-1-phosphate dehydrogenase [Methanotrichaceae archaeon]